MPQPTEILDAVAELQAAAQALLALVRESGGNGAPAVEIDLTSEQVAAAVGRSPSQVRYWLASGALPGYKLRGHAWRVRREDLRRFQDAERERYLAERAASTADRPSARTERRSRRLTEKVG